MFEGRLGPEVVDGATAALQVEVAPEVRQSVRVSGLTVLAGWISRKLSTMGMVSHSSAEDDAAEARPAARRAIARTIRPAIFLSVFFSFPWKLLRGFEVGGVRGVGWGRSPTFKQTRCELSV